jgi:anti-sigma B factor antagonist
VQPEFAFTIRDLPDVHVVPLSGELDVATATGLPEMLVAIAGSTVVVDLADVSFMDSSGIAAMVIARNPITEQGDRMVLTRPGGIERKAPRSRRAH